MGLRNNKKGVIFTGLAIAIISLFIISYTFYAKVQERKAVEQRVETMNSFIFSIEKDMSRQLYISGFRIIFLLEKNIVETDSYIGEVNKSFDEAFFNGTLNSVPQELLIGSTLAEIQDNINTIAKKMNMEIVISNPILEVTQDDPWRVKLILTAKLFVKDKNDLASWNKTESISAYVPIENFEDPLYFVSTNGAITKNITKSPYSTFVHGMDITNLSLHALNGYYINTSEAPSFLDRLEGRVDATSPYGIESLVNLQYLSQQNIYLQNKSVVDHIYFSSQNPNSYRISNMPNWFRLDQVHIGIYQATGIVL